MSTDQTTPTARALAAAIQANVRQALRGEITFDEAIARAVARAQR